MLNQFFSVFVGFMLLISSTLPQNCKECLERDTVPYKLIEQAVAGPLDSIRVAKTNELDSLKAIHDDVKETLDSLTAKKFIGHIDSFHVLNKKNRHKIFWWYYIDGWGNRNYSNTTEE